MTASKRRNHPSSKFHQSSHSSVFCPVSSWARLRETKLANHRRFHYSTNPFPENTHYHRQHHSQTNYYHRSSCGRTRGGSLYLESSHSSTSLAMNEGLTPGTLSSSYHNGHRTDNILLSSANRQTRMEGAEINKSLLALKECIR